MSITQNIAKHVLSDRLYESMRGESQAWVMRCACGAETSMWEMGGIRWKATGQLRRLGHCGTCRRKFWGTVYHREAPNGTSETMSQQPAIPIELDAVAALLLWIDGVGCWMVHPGESVTIGGPVEPGSSQPAADVCVLANLSRLHASIERTGETYRASFDDGAINGRGIEGNAFLRDGDEMRLGTALSMRFRTPSVLSPTAVLSPTNEPWPRMFTEGRTPASIDGIVLMDEVCLLGPGGDAHVPCVDWEETVILFRRNGQLWCRSQSEIDIDGRMESSGGVLSNGSVVSGDGWRFRVESVLKRGR